MIIASLILPIRRLAFGALGDLKLFRTASYAVRLGNVLAIVLAWIIGSEVFPATVMKY